MSYTSKDKEAEVEELVHETVADDGEEAEEETAKQKQKHMAEEEGVVKATSRGFSGATKFSDYRKTVITSPTASTTASKEEKSKDGKLVIKSRDFVAEKSSEVKKYEDYAYASDESDYDESNGEGTLTRFVKHLQDEIIEVAGDAKDFLKRSFVE